MIGDSSFCTKCGAKQQIDVAATEPVTTDTPKATPKAVTNPFVVGSNVLAKWTDGSYYPGSISEIRDNQALVNFDDGDVSWVNLTEIADSEDDSIIYEEDVTAYEDNLTVGESVIDAQMRLDDVGSFGLQLFILAAIIGFATSSWLIFLFLFVGLAIGVFVFKKFAKIMAVICAIGWGVIGWAIGFGGMESIIAGIVIALIAFILGLIANKLAVDYMNRRR